MLALLLAGEAIFLFTEYIVSHKLNPTLELELFSPII